METRIIFLILLLGIIWLVFTAGGREKLNRFLDYMKGGETIG